MKHTFTFESFLSKKLDESELNKIEDFLYDQDTDTLRDICDDLLMGDENYAEDKYDLDSDDLVGMAMDYIDSESIKLKDVKAIVESVNEANPDGTISDDEDERRAELLKRVKEQMEELLASAEFDANDIGGSFRSPGIMAEIRKELEKQVKKFR